MTNKEFLNRLNAVADATLTVGADDEVIRNLLTHVKLPESHLDLLKLANGISVFGGYFRLFGCRSSVTMDILEWNASETWKFAWNKPLDEFWFFGETAWGDQYAYLMDELKQAVTPRVFYIDGITMKERVLSDDFETFLENEVLRNATDPYDTLTIAARQRLGDLQPFEHIAYVPSLLITGYEDINQVSKLPAVSSMVINGDLYNQLADEHQNRPIKELQPYEDASGRMRIRVVWN